MAQLGSIFRLGVLRRALVLYHTCRVHVEMTILVGPPHEVGKETLLEYPTLEIAWGSSALVAFILEVVALVEWQTYLKLQRYA